MSRRPNARQRANARLSKTRATLGVSPAGVADEPRRPLHGFEDRYEITRSGWVWSRQRAIFLKRRVLYGPPYLEITVDGERVSLAIDEAVRQSWGDAPDPSDAPADAAQGRAQAPAEGVVVRVDLPATTILVVVADPATAAQVAIAGLAEEVRDGRLMVTTRPVRRLADVPEEWHDAIPFAEPAFDVSETVREHLDPASRPPLSAGVRAAARRATTGR